MNLDNAMSELERFRDFVASKPPSPKGTQMFEAIQTVLREIDRLQAIVAKLHPRVQKLTAKGRQFIVIGEHEPYYPEAYGLIRLQERMQGTWTPDDEDIYQAAIDCWHKLACKAAEAGGKS